jgi:site-specific recombinase XerD
MSAKTRGALFRGPSLEWGGAIDDYLGFVAIEKGLSDNYQLSNRRSLQELAAWCQGRGFQDPRTVQTDDLTAYLSYLKARPRRAPGRGSAKAFSIGFFDATRDYRYTIVLRLSQKSPRIETRSRRRAANTEAQEPSAAHIEPA